MKLSRIYRRNFALLAAALAVGTLGSIYSGHAQAIISNGSVKLGVDTLGNLNIPGGNPSVELANTLVGVRYVSPAGSEYEFTSQGCPCEGWGVKDTLGGTAAWVNNAYGAGTLGQNLTPVSFSSTATTAQSVVTAGALGELTITHDYKPSASAFLFEATVTLKNTSRSAQHVQYRREMDWDIEPTSFNEFVTIGGLPAGGAAASGDNVIYTSDNGFAFGTPADPAGAVNPGTVGVNFYHDGAADHGAIFDFDFGTLLPDESTTFTIFYGGAPNEVAAYGALATVSAELYSIGLSNGGGFADTESPVGIFGFKGVGLPPAELPVPEPSTVIGGIALAGLAASKMLRRKKA